MMSSTLGAPLGGTTLAGQAGLDSLASSLITPRKGCGGGGSCSPSIVVVALGEPGVPVVWMPGAAACWAFDGDTAALFEDSQPGSAPSESTSNTAASRSFMGHLVAETRGKTPDRGATPPAGAITCLSRAS